VRRKFVKEACHLNKVKLSFPWVMKISSKKIVHKVKVGGVITNIKNLEEARVAFLKLSKIENFQEALIQEQIKGEEMILGIKHTEEFSKVIMIGKGGTNVEREKDISFRVLPIKKEEIKKMVKELKCYNELKKNGANLQEIIKIVLKLVEIAKNHPKIQELDINPLIVNKKEATIVDARISTK
jgi:acetyltransferase